MPRHILALYNSTTGQTTDKNHVHENAEVILNHLGCIVDYWDVKEVLPDDRRMKQYFAVIDWRYSNELPSAEAYFKWMNRQINAGKKLLLLTSLTSLRDSKSGEVVAAKRMNRFTRKLGLQVYDSGWTNDISRIALVKKDPAMVEFERTLDFELSEYEMYRSVGAKNKVYLTLRRNDLRNSESDMVLTTPEGGFAHPVYVLYQNEINFIKKWRINPFRFFEEALGLQGTPRPDVTTINGLRIWCSHIDGDALISKTEVWPYGYCGDTIREEIVKKFCWPHSISVVVGELLGNEKFDEIARSIYQYEWVEAASHTYSHPFYWADDYAGKDQYEYRHLQIQGYEFSVKQEIAGSIDYINERLLPAGKKVKALYWSGNCLPTAEAITCCESSGVVNINGGDTIFDKKYSSYAHVTPLRRQVGNKYQIYSPNSNENVYTNEWNGPFYGFESVLETFRRTESPIRIKPINIYYHYYSGEKRAALKVLKGIMEETTNQDVAPLFLSEYVAVVQGFFDARISRLEDNGWQIEDYGKCTTVRFDRENRFPDLERSTGVIGFLKYQNALYVHLQEGEVAQLFLSENETKDVYIASASHYLRDLVAAKANVSFKTNGYGNGVFVVKNLVKNQSYRIRIQDQGQTTTTIAADASGTLRLTHPMRGETSFEISSFSSPN